MKYVAFILNLPWTAIALFAAVLSIPSSIRFRASHFALIVHVRSVWWYKWLPGKAGSRANALGHVVLLTPRVLPNDLEHELIHVEQAINAPLVQPLLYIVETVRHGYRNNKYEIEAYARAGNPYLERATK